MSKLKPLVWRLTNDYPNSQIAPIFESVSVFGVYQVHGSGRGYGGSDGHASWEHFGVGCAGYGPAKVDSIEHGKQLAEADYRQRVAGLFE